MTVSAAEAFAAMERLPLWTIEKIGASAITVIAPHPDDESLGCGGLIRLARDKGIPVKIIVVSDGTGSHPNSATYPPHRLRDVREDEARRAASELGVAARDLHFLRQMDREVPHHGPVVGQIAEIISRSGSNVIAVTWYEDPHCDHKACFALARSARERTGGRLFAYPIWSLALPPDSPIAVRPRDGFRLDIASARGPKRRAIAAHRSQITDLIADDPDGFRLTKEHLSWFDRDTETFLEISE
ncbi:MAG: PIG-L family deacetylase [Rhizobiales bacterium]|nr:PIG-L family deacetylase [Hyphomicrobiales bacterium]